MSSIKLVCIALFVTSLLFTGACGGPSQRDLETADFGTLPAEQVYKAAIVDYFERTLKDPASAQFKWGEPYKGYMGGKGLTGYHYGWVVPVEVNAKNSFGGYSGFKLYTFLLNDETWQLRSGPPSY